MVSDFVIYEISLCESLRDSVSVCVLVHFSKEGCLSLYFFLLFFFIFLVPFCFLMRERDRNSLDLGGVCGKDLGGVWGWVIVIRIYYMKKSIFN